MDCYVLIGGRSRRMGTPKAMLMLSGRTFAERVAAAARPVFARLIAVDRHGGSAAPAPFDSVIREAPRNELPGDESPGDESGDSETAAPLFGVVTALEHARQKAFIVAVDYPLLTEELLRRLRDRFASSAKPLLVPVWNGRMQMLCGGYAPSLLPRIRERIDRGQLDLRGLALPEETDVVSEEELRAELAGEPLMNVNTPDELAKARTIDESGR